jgi:flavin reductase (DIM6/NTAB) family NADH-FMN oxidoreductase RutF
MREPFDSGEVAAEIVKKLGQAPGNHDDGLPKDTARNCQRTGEFVIHLVDAPLAEVMNRTAAPLAYGISETEC